MGEEKKSDGESSGKGLVPVEITQTYPKIQYKLLFLFKIISC